MITKIIKNKVGSSFKNSSNYRFAFTLAELLVVLTIIGVIAVLTIPGLMQNTQSQQTKTKVKKAYTTLNEALSLCYRGNPDFTESSDTTYMSVYSCLAKKLNVKYYITWSSSEGWKDKTYTAPTVYANSTSVWIVTMDELALKPKILTSGITCNDALTINSLTSSEDVGNNNCATIVVDTNIEEGPDGYCSDSEDLNKLKCDRFYFPVDKAGQVVAGNPTSTLVGRIMEE